MSSTLDPVDKSGCIRRPVELLADDAPAIRCKPMPEFGVAQQHPDRFVESDIIVEWNHDTAVITLHQRNRLRQWGRDHRHPMGEILQQLCRHGVAIVGPVLQETETHRCAGEQGKSVVIRHEPVNRYPWPCETKDIVIDRPNDLKVGSCGEGSSKRCHRRCSSAMRDASKIDDPVIATRHDIIRNVHRIPDERGVREARSVSDLGDEAVEATSTTLF